MATDTSLSRPRQDDFPDVPVISLAELAAQLEDAPPPGWCVVCASPAPEDSDYCSRYCWEQDNFDAERRCDR